MSYHNCTICLCAGGAGVTGLPVTRLTVVFAILADFTFSILFIDNSAMLYYSLSYRVERDDAEESLLMVLHCLNMNRIQ